MDPPLGIMEAQEFSQAAIQCGTGDVLVILTEQGRTRVDAALSGLLDRERALLAGLGASERRRLADLMRILLAPFDAG